jgi:G3E family GTPase
MKAVYMINGFLESGKTEFICYTLQQPYFQTKGTTLLILCEEGEVEYPPQLLLKSHTVIERIEEEQDFQPAVLLELEKKHKPERIIIEYNGMWNFKNMLLPWHWTIEQQITIIDGSTFPQYYTNMRSLLAEMIRGSEMIVCNRCDGITELHAYKRNIKAVNPTAEVIFEDASGEIDTIFEDDLPYDLTQDKLKLDDQSYGIWYLDAMEHPERYEGKTLEFRAMVLKPEEFPKGYFVPGRMAMTCCADDMTFLGYACQFGDIPRLKERNWIQVTAVMKKEYFKQYNGSGPVLYATNITETKPPKEPIISFM